MIDIEAYISQLISVLMRKFGERLVYVGLQGSYLRGEATDHSDIDIMVVIDGLSVSDLQTYRTCIQTIGSFEKSCGFICSKEDLSNWNPLEMDNLLSGTRDYYGVLRTLVPTYTNEDVRNFIKFSINNLYHEICHRYIHAEDNKNLDQLAAAYKGVFFILQNLYYLITGKHTGTKSELLKALNGKNREIMQRALDLSNGAILDFDESFELLFTWCQETLASL